MGLSKRQQTPQLCTQTTPNFTFLCSHVHHKEEKDHEKNNRQTRTLHRLRTMRSILYYPTQQVQRHHQSLHKRNPTSSKPSAPRNEQTSILRHTMSTLRRRTMRSCMPNWRHAQRPRNWLSHTQQRQVYGMLDLRYGLSIRCSQD